MARENLKKKVAGLRCVRWGCIAKETDEKEKRQALSFMMMPWRRRALRVDIIK